MDVLPVLTIYFADEFGKDKAGLLLIFSQVFSVLANLMGGYCAERFGRKRMMVLAAFGQGVSFLVFASASSPWLNSPVLGFVCFALVGVFSSFYWPASQAMVRGQYFAASSLRFTIGKTIAPISIPLTVWIGYGHLSSWLY